MFLTGLIAALTVDALLIYDAHEGGANIGWGLAVFTLVPVTLGAALYGIGASRSLPAPGRTRLAAIGGANLSHREAQLLRANCLGETKTVD